MENEVLEETIFVNIYIYYLQWCNEYIPKVALSNEEIFRIK